MTVRRSSSPFHASEIAIQERLGVRDQMRAREDFLRDHLTHEQQVFFHSLTVLPIAMLDPGGWPVATVLGGPAGFARSTNATILEVDISRVVDPVIGHLQTGARFGALGIELATRRRNRVSGRVISRNDARIELGVALAYGNCPQYIQTREIEAAAGVDAAPVEPSVLHSATPETRDDWDDETVALIRNCDCFFIASRSSREASASHAVDISHRGGKPGFIRIEGRRLNIPDYPGNYFFNTFGNFAEDDRAVLLLWDFESGDLVRLFGRASVAWDDDSASLFRGAQRLWTFDMVRLERIRRALPGPWRLIENSPLLQQTGSWEEVANRTANSPSATPWRSYVVTEIVHEAVGIKSFHLRPQDDCALPVTMPGQYLPVRIPVAARSGERFPIRTYTLSNAPDDPFFRITVKRQEGLSKWLHENISVGDTVEAGKPSGRFVLSDDATRPAVLIAGGIGITPMIAMLRHSIGTSPRPRYRRPIMLFYAARRSIERAFTKELAHLLATSEGYFTPVYAVGERASDGVVHPSDQYVGRFMAGHFQDAIKIPDAEFYLCGPPTFMQAIYDILVDGGVDDGRIRAESFGPARLKRRSFQSDEWANKESVQRVRVAFRKSGVAVDWDPAFGSLLEIAEANGIPALYACRAGICGTCATLLIGGQVSYHSAPQALLEPGHVLTCSAVPSRVTDDPKDVVIELDL